MFYEDTFKSPYVYGSLLMLVEMRESVSLCSFKQGQSAEDCARDTKNTMSFWYLTVFLVIESLRSVNDTLEFRACPKSP